MPELLQVQGVTAGYGSTMVLREVSLEVAAGEIVALLGRNGVGKTTLLRAVAGFVPLRAGGMFLDGQPLAGTAPYRVARRRVCYVAQEQALFADMTVGENLRLGVTHDRLFRERLPLIEPHFPVLLRRLGQKAGTLSGGEQKMLLISRAIMSRPRLMLLDEISEGLQPSVVDRLAGVLAAERREHGTAMLLVEQNVAFALAVADRFAVLTSGAVVERGRTGETGVAARIERHMTV
jgi:ABC-type branched-subunit amino acid transport system ATPase component